MESWSERKRLLPLHQLGDDEGMAYTIEAEIARFERFQKSMSERYVVESLCEYAFVVKPRGVAVSLPPGKTIALSMMGIVHGNEWAGLGVLNGLLAHLQAGSINLEVPVAFIAGNPWAARDNKRFIDRDLNRSFARKGLAREEKRSAVLTPVLAQSAYLVDYHQTMRRSEHPFFIFPFSRRSFDFARDIAPRQTIVTHWGKPFSQEGMCSDEYVNSQGGVGLSLELGQNGFDPYQIGCGIDAGLWAIRTVTAYLEGSVSGRVQPLAEGEFGQVYTWAEIMPWPERGVVELDDDWHNFKTVAKDQRLGLVDGQELTAHVEGKMLFPKYLTREQQSALESRPTELCRIMKEVAESELPGSATT